MRSACAYLYPHVFLQLTCVPRRSIYEGLYTLRVVMIGVEIMNEGYLSVSYICTCMRDFMY